ncbi:MAG: NAD-dependent epimerase/dehydratase family protein [Betaproteobacteria bacterium]|nr:MAG: NAD-dependent epimerase/dehydratase family protein [Betaproteobacteria bacterium]
MNLLITGGAGFLGARLARTLLQRGTLAGQRIARLVLADRAAPQDAALTSDARVQVKVGDLAAQLPTLMAAPFDAIFHLAAAVSGECEADFELGMHANFDTTRQLLDACRAAGNRPRLVFSSSLAVFGSDPSLPLPEVVGDATLPTPQTSYGIQKFIGEQLVADYTRKGYIDGRSTRLATVSVRPGRPNAAASGFLSGIVREPLAGLPASCPVDVDTEVALTSPANTVAGLIAVVEADASSWIGRTAINLPALTVSVRAMLDALREIGGDEAVALVRFGADPSVARMVGGWPARVASERAQRLGLRADSDFRSIVLQYVRDNASAVTNARARAAAGLA